ncbi:tRNA (guanosine(37)-N1)-methyltransferase TrmD [Ruminococcus flavefaciens]|uniref:tRNA (guanine-N(1)-)-methyltransferase n=1 Tax=Ruminococcus flavefaciens 007c TaxID=1341157 RepID=W7UVN4_RUMFL|nr:tRNA (guanosine(37)-N1)-methyltransferase TrmD [Ruminococcus flavefaciens]EWM52915.1 tRNA (guanine-N1)-methyltransferase [Ruminococcus flavefaciens 007c]
MHIEIATLFPEMCEAVLSESIVGRARRAGKISLHCRQIREYTLDKHRRVDDTPYGGGMGMVMQCEPIYNCYKAVCQELGTKPHTIYMSPKGRIFDQKRAVELSGMDNILIICGHYEGVDQRVIDKIVDEELSIGDYVLTGGELPAMVVADTVARMCEGVLSDEVCFTDESIYSGLLEYPQYTRPEVWEGEAVPPVLLSGHHKNIENWRHEQSLKLTAERRPDLLAKYNAENK